MFGSMQLAASVLLVQTWFATPFLDLFVQQNPAPQIAERSVQLDAGGHQLAGYLAAPSDPAGRPLPAILMASGREGLTDALRQFAREIAGIGYAALAIDYRGGEDSGRSPLLRDIIGHPQDVEAALAWLSSQSTVDSRRIGVIAWNDAFDDVARLSEAGKVTAVYPVKLGSQSGMTEQEWVDVYEYFGTHVEDARVAEPPSPADAPVARVIDIMRAINSDQGVRGRLARALADPPSGVAEWEQARSDAAMLAEGGNLLLAQRPAKGSLEGWRAHARDFRSAAEALLRAIETRDFPAAQQRLRELPRTCAACHADHR